MKSNSTISNGSQASLPGYPPRPGASRPVGSSKYADSGRDHLPGRQDYQRKETTRSMSGSSATSLQDAPFEMEGRLVELMGRLLLLTDSWPETRASEFSARRILEAGAAILAHHGAQAELVGRDAFSIWLAEGMTRAKALHHHLLAIRAMSWIKEGAEFPSLMEQAEILVKMRGKALSTVRSRSESNR